MRIPVILLMIACSSSTLLFGQTDSTFSVMRNGTEAKFPFTKLTRPEHLKTVSNSMLPLYSFNKTQYTRIKDLLINFAQMENEYRLLMVNRNEKDSVFTVKEKMLTENMKLEGERAKNFERSYNTLLTVNAQLNDQVKKAEQLAIHEHKKKKLKSILFGALAFSAGVVIGVTVR